MLIIVVLSFKFSIGLKFFLTLKKLGKNVASTYLLKMHWFCLFIRKCKIHLYAVLCLVARLCLTLCDPMDCSLQAPLSMGILQARILEWVAMPSLPLKSSHPCDRTHISCIVGRPSELPGKSKNTGMGSLFLIQGIFSTQELNWGLLLCRWILYQLSYQRSPHLYTSSLII